MSVGLFTGLLGGLLLLSPLGVHWEENIGLAWLFNLRGPIAAPEDVVVVDMDNTSVEALSQPEKIRDWRRATHAELIDRLVARGAAVIVFDIFFEKSRSGDPALAASMTAARQVVLVQYLRHQRIGGILFEEITNPTDLLDQAASGLAPFPLPEVPNRVSQFWSFLGDTETVPTLPVVALHVNTLQSVGYPVIRRLLTRAGFTESLPEAVTTPVELRRLMADMHHELRNDAVFRARLMAMIDGDTGLSAQGKQIFATLIQIYDSPRSHYFNYYGPAKTVKTVPYHAVMDSSGRVIQELTGKTVFVGSQKSSPFDNDKFFTVYTGRDGLDLSGVEITATAYANLLSNSTLRYPGPVAAFALLFAFGLLIGSTAARPLGIWVSVALTSGITLGYIGVIQFLFVYFNLWMPLLIPALIQLPVALLFGLLLQYLETNRTRRNVAQALRYHVPENVVARLAESGDPVLPQRVYGTCLASDIAGYTTIAEKITPQDLVERNNEYFGLIGDCIRRHRGQMLDITGDGLTCAWPARQPSKEDRKHACLAALEVVNAVQSFNRRHADYPFHTRIGLDTGWFVMGHVGGAGHYTFSVAGDIVNSASRIEGLNKYLKTTLLASHVVVDGLDDHLLMRPLGSFQLKGKANSLRIFEIMGPREQESLDSRQLCDMFVSALSLFSEHRWQDAADRFKTLLEFYPGDGPTHFYLERCALYLRSALRTPIGATIRLENK